VGLPAGLSALGYTGPDVPPLVEGTLKQQSLLATAAVDVGAEDLAGIFHRSLELW
jgi:hypothetical protein